MPDLDETMDAERQRVALHAALRDELIQVASVAAAAIIDLDYGSTSDPHPFRRLCDVWLDVERERQRQETKWGPQHHDSVTWLAILGEEFGEACQAAMRLTMDEVRAADLGAIS